MMIGMTSTASADYIFVVPQKPGGGTTVWTEIVAKELAPFLGEKIIIKTIPGARDIPGTLISFITTYRKTIRL